jgi:betaine-aldehyde dehydrogenase
MRVTSGQSTAATTPVLSASDGTVLIDPRTGQPRGRVVMCREPEVTTAVAAARSAQPDWEHATPRERSRRLLRFAQAIEDDGEAFVAAERAGTGKPQREAETELAASIDIIRFYAGALRTGLTPASGHHLPGCESWVRWEPLGVVGVIVPWNYPLLMAAWRLGPALAAGNTVVLKPAETTPDTALLMEDAAATVLGDGVLTVVPGDRETGKLLVESAVDAVAFTGSFAGGRDVRARAGVRPVSLELGGNCPAVVLPDAPVDTFESLASACTYNAGQSCAAPARVITLQDNYDAVAEQLSAAMSRRRAGVDFGPLNNRDQLDRYDQLTSASAATVQGVAELALDEAERDGFWRPARVLANLPADDPAVTEEVFGPVLTIQAAGDVDDAVRLANGVPQALAGSVWSMDSAQALEVATRLDCGEAWVNCVLEQTAELPHGGRRASGHGVDMSVLALTDYQRPKTVTVRVHRPGEGR